MKADDCPIDPFQVASRMAPDAVLGYHTALAFHGNAYSVWNYFDYLTHNSNIPILRLRGAMYRAVSQPATLRRAKLESWGVETVDRLGVDVKVTSIERTFVDAIDRLDLCGGFEEVWPCLEMIQYLKLQPVIDYTLLLENSTLAAKVGFFLEQHKKQFEIKNEMLQQLSKHRPRLPHKVLNGSKEGKLISKWNLIIPANVINREWEEFTWQ
jgi:predicted transcriptional regulator of viral defense system